MSLMIGLFGCVERQRLSLLDASLGVADSSPLVEDGIGVRSPFGVWWSR